MRELRFRAWNGRAMVYGGFSIHATGKFISSNNERILAGLTDPDEDYPVMQWTGLHDKHGEELYEGDLLEWLGTVRQITVSENHGFRFMYGEDILCKAYAVEGEIVGNIYET